MGMEGSTPVASTTISFIINGLLTTLNVVQWLLCSGGSSAGVLPLSFFSPSTNQTNIRLSLAEIAGATKMPCRFEELARATGLKPARRALLFARMQSRSQYQHHNRFHSITIS